MVYGTQITIVTGANLNQLTSLVHFSKISPLKSQGDAPVGSALPPWDRAGDDASRRMCRSPGDRPKNRPGAAVSFGRIWGISRGLYNRSKTWKKTQILHHVTAHFWEVASANPKNMSIEIIIPREVETSSYHSRQMRQFRCKGVFAFFYRTCNRLKMIESA